MFYKKMGITLRNNSNYLKITTNNDKNGWNSELGIQPIESGCPNNI